jgi:hypothetical protein
MRSLMEGITIDVKWQAEATEYFLEGSSSLRTSATDASRRLRLSCHYSRSATMILRRMVSLPPVTRRILEVMYWTTISSL